MLTANAILMIFGFVFAGTAGVVSGHQWGVNSVLSSKEYCRTETMKTIDAEVEQCYTIEPKEPRLRIDK